MSELIDPDRCIESIIEEIQTSRSSSESGYGRVAKPGDVEHKWRALRPCLEETCLCSAEKITMMGSSLRPAVFLKAPMNLVELFRLH